MSSVPFPRISARVMADDGNDLQFCTTCAFSHACLSQGMDKAALMDLHVLGFHFPGEGIGLNAIDGHRYPCDAIALDTVMLCRFSFPKISVLASRVPGLQRELFRLLSRDIGRAALLAGDWTADQRVAAFLVGMSRRLAARGFSASHFQLTMARTDIANYLRLAPETVSRVLRRMQDDGLLAVERRDVCLLDRERIEALSAPILRE